MRQKKIVLDGTLCFILLRLCYNRLREEWYPGGYPPRADGRPMQYMPGETSPAGRRLLQVNHLGCQLGLLPCLCSRLEGICPFIWPQPLGSPLPLTGMMPLFCLCLDLSRTVCLYFCLCSALQICFYLGDFCCPACAPACCCADAVACTSTPELALGVTKMLALPRSAAWVMQNPCSKSGFLSQTFRFPQLFMKFQFALIPKS